MVEVRRMGGRFARAHGSSRFASRRRRTSQRACAALRVRFSTRLTCGIKNVHPFWERTVVFGGLKERGQAATACPLLIYKSHLCSTQTKFGSSSHGGGAENGAFAPLAPTAPRAARLVAAAQARGLVQPFEFDSPLTELGPKQNVRPSRGAR